MPDDRTLTCSTRQLGLRRNASSRLGLVVVSLSLIGGCGPSGPERVVVRGRVTFQGEPVRRGLIRFLPEAGTEAPMSGAVIEAGRYAVEIKGGVPVGTHRVEIEAFPVGPAEHDVNVPVGRQYLPARWNRQSELRITIPSESGPLTRDFDLSS